MDKSAPAEEAEDALLISTATATATEMAATAAGTAAATATRKSFQNLTVTDARQSVVTSADLLKGRPFITSAPGGGLV